MDQGLLLWEYLSAKYLSQFRLLGDSTELTASFEEFEGEVSIVEGELSRSRPLVVLSTSFDRHEG